MFQTYTQAMEYLYSRLPFFSRDGKSAIKKNLDNTLALCKLIGNPEKKLNIIHVAGTNGKGSVSHGIAAVLQKHGIQTGLYTSPHLTDFRERFRCNGIPAPQSFVLTFLNTYYKEIEEIKPSFFELSFAIALAYFEHTQVTWAVIEVGLGGRLDSTNIVSPKLCVITHIALDHQDLLGDTLELIAAEKAGIIKHNIPVVIGRIQKETQSTFLQAAQKQNAPLYYAETLPISQPQSDLLGLYQKENMKTVNACFYVLKKHQILSIPKHTIQEALLNVKTLTGLRGRWDILQKEHPKVIADTGHNEEGIHNVVTQLKSEKFEQLHVVMGMVNDKSREKIWKLLPSNALYYFCKPQIPRGLETSVLLQEATEAGLQGTEHLSCEQALSNALNCAKKNDLVFVGCSTFVVAELIHYFESNRKK